MDDQFRNRFRRTDQGAPLRPRPDALPLRPAAPQPPLPMPQPQPAPSSQPLPVTPPAAQPLVTPSRSPQREAAPVRPAVEQPSPRPQPVTKPPKPPRPAGRKRGRRILALLVVLVLLGGAGGAAYWFVLKPRLHRSPAVPVQAANNANQTTGKMIRLVAVGDSMTYTSLNQAAQSGGSYNYAPFMTAIKPLFEKADVRVCSQTVPAAATTAASVSGPPTFNAPTQFAKNLEDTGCNVIDLASPNTNDKGQSAIDASVGNFDKHINILATAGANRSVEEQSKIRYFTVEGLKLAYLSYTTKSNVANPTPYGVNVYSDELADKQIKEAKKNAGIVIVSMHWGTDQASAEDSEQNTIAQHLATQNVDIVLGNGPHEIQPVKVLSGTDGHQTLVWFSLGNFLNTQVPLETLIGGMAVMDIDASTQKLHNPRILPLYMHYEWTAEQKARQNEADLLARKNYQLVPLDTAADLLAKSQNNTTVQAQQDRVKGIVNKYFQIPVITSTDL